MMNTFTTVQTQALVPLRDKFRSKQIVVISECFVNEVLEVKEKLSRRRKIKSYA